MCLLMFISCACLDAVMAARRGGPLSHPTPLDQLAMVMVWSLPFQLSSLFPLPPAHVLSFSPCCAENTALHSYKNGLSCPTSASNPFGDGDAHVTTCEVTAAISAILLPQRLKISGTLISGYRRDTGTSVSISHPSLAFTVYLTACYLFRSGILHGVYLRAKSSQCEKSLVRHTGL